MFKEWNHINITILTLSSIMILMVFLLLLFRSTSLKKYIWFFNTNQKNHVGKINKDLNEFHLSLSVLKNHLYFYNALIKNDYSKSKFSLIPGLYVTGNKAYIITNLIKGKKINEVLLNPKQFAKLVKTNTKEVVYDSYNSLWYESIQKFLNSKILNNIDIEFITPIINNDFKVVNNIKNNNVVPIYEIESFIKKQSLAPLSLQEKERIKNKINKLNLFNKRQSIEKIRNV